MSCCKIHVFHNHLTSSKGETSLFKGKIMELLRQREQPRLEWVKNTAMQRMRHGVEEGSWHWNIPLSMESSLSGMTWERFGIRNALFILSGKWVLRAMWHWICNRKQQLLPPPAPLLERAWSFLMDKGRNLPLGMSGADAQEYFACIMTMLRLQRSRKKKGMKREIMCWNFFPLKAGICRYPQNHFKHVVVPWGSTLSLEEPQCVLGFGAICRRRGQLCLQARWRLRWFLTTLLLPVPS